MVRPQLRGHRTGAFVTDPFSSLVTNSTYTPAAGQRAAILGIRLLHHDDLDSLEECLGLYS